MKLAAAALLLLSLAPAHGQVFGSGNANRFRGRTLSTCSPLNGQAYTWNTSTQLWECTTPNTAITALKFILQTADAGAANAQSLGALGTGILKNTTGTGILGIAVAADLPLIPEIGLTLSDVTTKNVSITAHGFVPKAPNDNTQAFCGDGNWGTTCGGGSAFAGSTASAPAFSATPTISLANVGSKSPTRFEPGAMTANVTAVTFTNKTAGAKFSIAWLQDGTGSRTVAYGASASNTCTLLTTAGSTTTQNFEVKADGSTVVGTGCTVSGAPNDLLFCVPGSSSGTVCVYGPASGGGNLTFPIGADTLMGKATTDVMTNKTLDTAGAGNVLKVNGTTLSAVSGTGAVCLASGSSCGGGADISSAANVVLKEEFPNVRLGTSGNFGELGWGSTGCTPGATTSVANHFGIANIFTAAVNGTTCAVRLTYDGATNNFTGLNSGTWSSTFVFQITSGAIGSQTIKFGLGSADGDTANSCAGNCILIQHDTSVSTSLGLLTCAAGVCTTTGPSSGAIVTALNTWYQVTISGAAGTVTMTVKQGANTQTTTNATNIPSGNMTAYLYLKDVTSQPNVQWDFWSFSQTGLTRY